MVENIQIHTSYNYIFNWILKNTYTFQRILQFTVIAPLAGSSKLSGSILNLLGYKYITININFTIIYEIENPSKKNNMNEPFYNVSNLFFVVKLCFLTANKTKLMDS